MISKTKLQAWKEENRIKNKTLADLMGITSRQVARIFNGHCFPSFRILLLIRRMTTWDWDTIMKEIYNEKQTERLNKQSKKLCRLKIDTTGYPDMSTIEGRKQAVDIGVLSLLNQEIQPYPRA